MEREIKILAMEIPDPKKSGTLRVVGDLRIDEIIIRDFKLILGKNGNLRVVMPFIKQWSLQGVASHRPLVVLPERTKGTKGEGLKGTVPFN
jgi:hypothetical protein